MIWKLYITSERQSERVLTLDRKEYVVGRSDACEVVLDGKMVSGRHAVLRCSDHEVQIEDLHSTNGTFVDGTRLTRPFVLRPEMPVQVGEFTLVIKSEVRAEDTGVIEMKKDDLPPLPKPPKKEAFQVEPLPPSGRRAVLPASVPVKDFSGLDASLEKPFSEAQQRKREQYRQIREEVHKELFNRMDLKRMVMSGGQDDEMSEKARQTIATVIDEMSDRIPSGISKGQLASDVYDEALGLGPLEPFLADARITEVMVNGHDSIYYERGGKLFLSESQFLDDQQLMGIIERIVAPIGRRVDESQPMVDARLKDGSRVNVIIPPLALKGPSITIRKFAKTPYKVSDLIKFGSMTPEMAEFFRICVQLRKNVLISGGTGSGKTTLLNVLSSYLPVTERIVTIEDAAELRLNQHHVISLESRPPNIEGRGAITIRDLVRNALRMRPDRIVVGECRGGEALDMLQAMNTGHDGSLTTAHANSPRDALARMETMVLMAGMDLPMRAIREQMASAVHLIIQQDRFSDGTRKITSVTEVVGMENDIITLQEIFKYVQTGIDETGKVKGYFTATGGMPTFWEEIKVRGLQLDPAIFNKADVVVG